VRHLSRETARRYAAIHMKVLRTPEERFAGLPDFGYQPRYADGGGLRLAYVEAGPPAGEPVLLLHGEPSWSFLYRKVIPVLAEAGLRVIAADLIGFGRSDKPAEVRDHSYARHVEWVRAFAFDALGLSGVTLVGQDWGGLIGLRLVAEHPDRFARVVAANTGLPTGDQPMPDVWLRFREVVRTAPALSVSRLVQSGCRTTLPADVLAAYEAPFPDPSYAGPRARHAGQSRVRGQPGGLAAARRVGQAVPGGVQRPRPDHRRDGAGAEARRAGRGGPGAPGARRSRPLPPRGRRGRARGGDRGVRPHVTRARRRTATRRTRCPRGRRA
jgi:pimeloyl-ACP methyl ester carboxylesterase